MKTYLCISRKERNVYFWADHFRIGRVYKLDRDTASIYTYQMLSKKGHCYDVDKHAFIPMRTVWAGIALFIVLFLAMTGESLIDIILKIML